MNLTDIFLSDISLDFVLEIVIRCFVMYVLIIIVLRLSGKRGVKQLSIFEIAIILSLGSAAGDPMFYKEIPLIYAFIVFTVIILLYRLTTYMMMKSERLEIILEGKPMYIVKNGLLIIDDIKEEKYSYDEFFAELRQNKVEQLGQVKVALLETDGSLSVIQFSKNNIQWGLPIFPDLYHKAKSLKYNYNYSCMACAYTAKINSLDDHCPRCNKSIWAESLLH
ncbi:DUF421 domain-containing protein [Acinetobacter chinensis]|uniref:DUF421 domain-containing protein n=1 Tax=Acinetobacter chinensis TaxID=2004650 RepID=A0A3B7LVR9_9GAMM|nr:DUF421 domain-containing protein [Acinetobacter chinensis]AXY56658.1 DUF421 domain-containing protein [Acinetobacter chinensis]